MMNYFYGDFLDSIVTVIQAAHLKLGFLVIVVNATFNNISVISWWSVLLVEEIRVSG